MRFSEITNSAEYGLIYIWFIFTLHFNIYRLSFGCDVGVPTELKKGDYINDF